MRKGLPGVRESIVLILGFGLVTFLMLTDKWAELGVPTAVKVAVWFTGGVLTIGVGQLAGRGDGKRETPDPPLSAPTFRILWIVTVVGALIAADVAGDRYELSFWARRLVVLGVTGIGIAVHAGLSAWWHRTRWTHGRKLRRWPPGEENPNR